MAIAAAVVVPAEDAPAAAQEPVAKTVVAVIVAAVPPAIEPTKESVAAAIVAAVGVMAMVEVPALAMAIIVATTEQTPEAVKKSVTATAIRLTAAVVPVVHDRRGRRTISRRWRRRSWLGGLGSYVGAREPYQQYHSIHD